MNKAEIQGDCVVIDFSKEFIEEYNGTKEEETKLIYSLVKDSIVINALLLLISLLGIVSAIKLINWNLDKL